MNVDIVPPNKRRHSGGKILKVLILLSVLIVISITAFLYLFATRPELPKPFEIQNYYGEVEYLSYVKNVWLKPVRGQKIDMRDIIRTGESSELELRTEKDLRVRVREKTQLELQPPRLTDRVPTYWLNLQKGSVFVMTETNFRNQAVKTLIQNKKLETDGGAGLFEKSPSMLTASLEQGTMLAHTDRLTGKVWLGMLRGEAEVRGGLPWDKVKVHSLEKIDFEAKQSLPSQATTVSRTEWNRLQEAYELFQKSAAVEAQQLDLSKNAGSLFAYVFDHGTFFTPNLGHAGREFYKDPEGGDIILDLDYDVFPKGSFVGMYIKTRGLDLHKYKALQFEVRRKPRENYPDQLRIEFKSDGGVVRGYAAKMIRRNWEAQTFDFNTRRETPVEEITLVISHDKVGPTKKGAIQLRNVTLIPVDPVASHEDPGQSPKGQVPDLVET